MDNPISKSEISRLILIVDSQLQDAKGEDYKKEVKLSYLLESLINELAEANNIFIS
jgi:hypothetical protein